MIDDIGATNALILVAVPTISLLILGWGVAIFQWRKGNILADYALDQEERADRAEQLLARELRKNAIALPSIEAAKARHPSSRSR